MTRTLRPSLATLIFFALVWVLAVCLMLWLGVRLARDPTLGSIAARLGTGIVAVAFPALLGFAAWRTLGIELTSEGVRRLTLTGWRLTTWAEVQQVQAEGGVFILTSPRGQQRIALLAFPKASDVVQHLHYHLPKPTLPTVKWSDYGLDS